MNLPILDEIYEALDTVTEHEIERASAKLEKVRKGEVKLGEIYEPFIIRLYTLAWRYSHSSIRIKQQAEWDATNNIDREELLVKAVRDAALSSFCMHLCLTLAKFQVGHKAMVADLDNNNHLRLRTNFVLVVHTHSPIDILQAFQAIEGGE